MSVYVGIRGWVECEDEQLAELREIAEAADAVRAYRGGWSFPAEQCMWGNTAFFAADMHARYTDTVLEQMRRIAALPAPSGDEEEHVRGLFRVSNESEGTVEWQLRDGGLLIVAGHPGHDYLEE